MNRLQKKMKTRLCGKPRRPSADKYERLLDATICTRKRKLRRSVNPARQRQMRRKVNPARKMSGSHCTRTTWLGLPLQALTPFTPRQRYRPILGFPEGGCNPALRIVCKNRQKREKCDRRVKPSVAGESSQNGGCGGEMQALTDLRPNGYGRARSL